MALVHEAAERNDVEALQSLLDAEPELMVAETNLSWTPLQSACYAGSLEAARFLLDRGAVIDRRDREGATALMAACEGGRPEVVKLLLARGADPALRDEAMRTALIYACYKGFDTSVALVHRHVAVLRLLINDGRVPVDARSCTGFTALWLVCATGCTERVRVLLVEGRADYTIADDRGNTSIYMATRWLTPPDCTRLIPWFQGELEKPFLISKARAVVDDTESISKAPEKAGARTRSEAQQAREEAAPSYLRGRLSRGEALPAVEVVGQRRSESEVGQQEEVDEVHPWLEYVVCEMKGDLVKELMEGLDAGRQCRRERRSTRERASLQRKRHQAFNSITRRFMDGMALVHEAARRNDVDTLQSLLDAEPELMVAENGFGWTALQSACYAGSLKAVLFLLDRGAVIDRRDYVHATALMMACEAGRPEVVELLLARGADPTLLDGRMRTALTYACLVPGHRFIAAVPLLLKDGPVNARNQTGKTAVWWACAIGCTERVRMLLMEGRADRRIADDDGKTPMEVARGDCKRLLGEWWEGELEKPFLLSKARAVVDDTESITRAPEKVGARTRAEAQQAREKAAPLYLRGRVKRGEALPAVEVVKGQGRRRRRGEVQEDGDEGHACLKFVVCEMKEDLVKELMEGLRYRWAE